MGKSTIRKVGLVILAVNISLLACKSIVWYLSGSVAVGVESLNSFVDVIYSVIVFTGLYITTRPPDESHPHGHERIEPFISLFISFFVILVALFLIYETASTVVFSNSTVNVTNQPFAIAILLVSIIMKYTLYRYCIEKGDNANSPAITAAGKESLMDVMTAAVAVIGVISTVIGYPVFDIAAGFVISMVILWTGTSIARENIQYLTGKAPDDELKEDIIETAMSHPKAEGTHDVVIHHVGPEIDVSLHIEVEGDMSLIEAHEMESTIVEDIRKFEKVDDVFIHIDPKELDEWKDNKE